MAYYPHPIWPGRTVGKYRAWMTFCIIDMFSNLFMIILFKFALCYNEHNYSSSCGLANSRRCHTILELSEVRDIYGRNTKSPPTHRLHTNKLVGSTFLLIETSRSYLSPQKTFSQSGSYLNNLA